MSSTFDFTNKEIGSNVILHLTRTNHAVAIIKFIDDSGNQIAIPPELVVYTRYFQTNHVVVQKPIDEIYALCWSDDYHIEYNEKVVLEINTNRTWNLKSY